MKKLLVILFLAYTQAYAETAATMNNASGGITVLTDVGCANNKGFIVYSQSPRSSTLFGCWWSDDSMVHITWEDGDFRSYPFDFITQNISVLNRMRSRNRKGNV